MELFDSDTDTDTDADFEAETDHVMQFWSASFGSFLGYPLKIYICYLRDDPGEYQAG